jgi:hypothetical protein
MSLPLIFWGVVSYGMSRLFDVFGEKSLDTFDGIVCRKRKFLNRRN